MNIIVRGSELFCFKLLAHALWREWDGKD